MLRNLVKKLLVKGSDKDPDSASKQIGEHKSEDVYRKYYGVAELHMDMQWATVIYPIIKDCDFTHVLELAPGHGRNTEKLIKVAGEISLVDVTESCITACKERFKNYRGRCKLNYFVNDGRTMPQIENGSVTFIYSWDSMVHFDLDIVKSYIVEFSRILRPGGFGFIHHSNYSAHKGRYWRKNPHCRNYMSSELFSQLCKEVGLDVRSSKVIDWGGVKGLDCMTLFKKSK